MFVRQIEKQKKRQIEACLQISLVQNFAARIALGAELQPHFACIFFFF